MVRNIAGTVQVLIGRWIVTEGDIANCKAVACTLVRASYSHHLGHTWREWGRIKGGKNGGKRY